MLNDVAVFLRDLKEIAVTVPFEVWGTVVIGSIGLGALGGWYARRFLRPERTGPAPLPPPPEPDPLPPPPPQPEPDPPRSHSCSEVDRLVAALDGDDGELWQFHPAAVPRDLHDLIHNSRMRVLTLINLKGGVGKTTLAANLAAYFERQDERVLLIDFDYQGSLSATVLRAAGRVETYSEADLLLLESLSGNDLLNPQRRMAPRLSRLTLVPAEFELNRQETRLLVRWLVKDNEQDPRYALTRVLSSPIVSQEFKTVIIDTPPRLGMATLNALCASTHVIIPTILEGGSILNVRSLLGQLDRWFRQDLNPRLDLAGIVGMMTAEMQLDGNEQQQRMTVEEAAQDVWGKRAGGVEAIAALQSWPEDAYVFARSIPHTARFREDAGRDVAYLDERATNRRTREVIDALGAQIAVRVGL